MPTIINTLSLLDNFDCTLDQRIEPSSTPMVEFKFQKFGLVACKNFVHFYPTNIILTLSRSLDNMVLGGSSISTEIRLCIYVVGLYVCFIYWGYLQEKLTSKPYTSINREALEWEFPFALNFCMATTSFLIAYTLHCFSPSSSTSSPTIENQSTDKSAINNKISISSKSTSKSLETNNENSSSSSSGSSFSGSNASFYTYWKAGLTCSLASPVGYASLKYITFPMMVLTKSSKPIPGM